MANTSSSLVDDKCNHVCSEELCGRELESASEMASVMNGLTFLANIALIDWYIWRKQCTVSMIQRMRKSRTDFILIILMAHIFQWAFRVSFVALQKAIKGLPDTCSALVRSIRRYRPIALGPWPTPRPIDCIPSAENASVAARWALVWAIRGAAFANRAPWENGRPAMRSDDRWSHTKSNNCPAHRNRTNCRNAS